MMFAVKFPLVLIEVDVELDSVEEPEIFLWYSPLALFGFSICEWRR